MDNTTDGRSLRAESFDTTASNQAGEPSKRRISAKVVLVHSLPTGGDKVILFRVDGGNWIPAREGLRLVSPADRTFYQLEVQWPALPGSAVFLLGNEDALPFFNASPATGGSSSGTDTVTNITPAASPYAVVAADQVIVADNTTGAIVVNLPAPSIGRRLIITTILTPDVGAALVTVNAAGGTTIAGAAAIVVGGGYPGATGSDRRSLFLEGLSATKWAIVAGTTTLGNQVDGIAGTLRALRFTTAGLLRWEINADDGPESGGNSGSSFNLNAASDSGLVVNTVFQVQRAVNGALTLFRDLAVTGSVWFQAAFRLHTVAKVFANSPYAVAATDFSIYYDATGGVSTVNLPTPVGNGGRRIRVTKSDITNNKVTIATPAGAIFPGNAASYDLLLQGEALELESDGANWWMV